VKVTEVQISEPTQRLLIEMMQDRQALDRLMGHTVYALLGYCFVLSYVSLNALNIAKDNRSTIAEIRALVSPEANTAVAVIPSTASGSIIENKP